MKTAIGENAAVLVSRSLPLMERHRPVLQRAIGRYMARCGRHDRETVRHEAAGRAIMDMLFDYARGVGAGSSWPHLDEAAHRHHLQGVGPGDYSRFGDGLGAVMRDVLGPAATPSLRGAWGDAYWALVRGLRRKPLALAA